MAFRTIFEPLVVIGGDGKAHPFLAASITTDKGGKTHEVRLRPGIHFHDGRPLTSADVKYTFQALSKRLRGRWAVNLAAAELLQIYDISTPNDRTVRFHLRRRSYLFPALLAEIPILPAHLYKRRGLSNSQLGLEPVGSGPFRVLPDQDKTSRKTRLELVRNEQYWGQAPRLGRIVFTAIADPSHTLARLRNGELDLVPRLHLRYYPDQVKGESMKRRFRLLRILPYRFRLMLFNLRRGPLKDRRLRLALAKLIDRQRMVRELRNELGQVLSVPIWPLSPWNEGAPHPYSYDRTAGARLLDAAGWTLGKAKAPVRRRNGVPLRLSLLVAKHSPQMAAAAAMIKGELAHAGIQIVIRPADFGYLKLMLRRGRYDLALLGLAPRPQSDLSPLLHSDGRVNFGRYKNPEVDRLLDAVRRTPPRGDRMTYLRQMYRVLHADPPFLILYAPIEMMVISRRARGLANNGRWPIFSTLSVSSFGSAAEPR